MTGSADPRRLLALLGDPDPGERERAAAYLGDLLRVGEFGGAVFESVVSALVALVVRERAESVREEALHALLEAGTVRVVPPAALEPLQAVMAQLPAVLLEYADALLAPLIFLDVDGPLIPFQARAAGHPASAAVPDATGNPLVGRLDPGDGARLTALGGRLVWATTWGDEANEVVAPRLGLPPLPVVTWPDEDEDPGLPGVHWKTAGLCAWANRRAFVWLDDEISEADRRWVAAHHPGRALLHRVDSYQGLTENDLAVVRRWIGQPR